MKGNFSNPEAKDLQVHSEEFLSTQLIEKLFEDEFKLNSDRVLRERELYRGAAQTSAVLHADSGSSDIDTHLLQQGLEEYGNLKTYNQEGLFVINLLEAMLERSDSMVLNKEGPFKVFCNECDAFVRQTSEYSTTCFPIPAVETLFDFCNSYLMPEDREDYASALTIKIDDSP